MQRHERQARARSTSKEKDVARHRAEQQMAQSRTAERDDSREHVTRKGSKEMMGGLKRSESKNLQQAVSGGIAMTGDIFDQEKKEMRVVKQLLQSKQRMNDSVERLNMLMGPRGHFGLMAGGGRVASRSPVRKSSKGQYGVEDGSMSSKMVKRMSKMAQSESKSAGNDIHARLCAESIQHQNEGGTEIDTADKSSISVRQLLTIDNRMSREDIDPLRMRSKEDPDDESLLVEPVSPAGSHVPAIPNSEDLVIRKRDVKTYRASKEAAPRK